MNTVSSTSPFTSIPVPLRLREWFPRKPCFHHGPNGCRCEMFVESISRVRSSFVEFHWICALGHTETSWDVYLPCGWPRRLLRRLGITLPPPDESSRVAA